MKSAKRKMGGPLRSQDKLAFLSRGQNHSVHCVQHRRKKRALSLHAKQGKDRSRQNKQDRQLEEKVKLRGFNLEQKKQEDTEEKTV